MESKYEAPQDIREHSYGAPAGPEGFMQTGVEDVAGITPAATRATEHQPQTYQDGDMVASAPPIDEYDYVDSDGLTGPPQAVDIVRHIRETTDEQGYPIGYVEVAIRTPEDEQGWPIPIKEHPVPQPPVVAHIGDAIPDGRPVPERTIHRDPVPRTLDEYAHDLVFKGIGKLLGRRGNRQFGRREHLGHAGHDIEGL